MKFLSFLLFLVGCQTSTNGEKCAVPSVSNQHAFIYRSYPIIRVKVTSCFYKDDSNDQNNYYDITPNCLDAIKTGTFIDKYNELHYVKSNNTQIISDEYMTDADPLTNTIYLRSGKKCRYDAGFCYDPKESLIYAVTWNVPKLPLERCSNNLIQIFHGNVDFWSFEPENRKYLIYTVPFTDESFFLSLSNSSFCRNEQVWYADENGYIVSFTPLTSVVRSNQKLFPPLKPKNVISDSILENCNLKSYGLNFDIDIDVSKLENLETILKMYQQVIDGNKRTLENLIKKSQNNSVEQKFKKISENNRFVNNHLSVESKIKKIVNMSLHVIEQQIQQRINEEKSFKEDLKNFYNTFNSKLSASKEEINNISKFLDQLDEDEKLNPLLTSVNMKINDTAKDVSYLKTALDASSKKIDTSNFKLNDLEYKLNEYKSKLENNMVLNQVSFEVVDKNISAIYSYIEGKIKNCFQDSHQNITEHLETLTTKINLSEEKIKNIQKRVNDEQLNNSKTEKITLELLELEDNLNSLPESIEDTIMKKVMPTFFLVFDKAYKCEREINQLKFEFDQAKEIFNQTIQRILSEHKKYDQFASLSNN